MESDRELLRQYAMEGQQAAFAEVVRRHTNLVYSVALRLVAGDAPLAQDVAQVVFTTLSRKAGSLAGRENLLGWLHTTTRYAASVAVRGERRRRTYEQEASTMMHNDDFATTERDWLQLRPTLDEAIGCLGAQDREAVLLRFFQGKSHREVGAELGWNEVMTRKRVDRALEKLRVHLSRRGLTLSTALLAGIITTHSVQAAPVGLAANLGTVALANAAHAGVAGGALSGLSMTTKTKSVAAAAAIIILFAAIPVTATWRQTSGLNAQNAALVEQNAALEKSVKQLNADLSNATSGQLLDNAVAKTPGSGADYVPVNLDAIRNMVFALTNTGSFTLNDRAAALLGLTSTEASQVQNVLDDLHKRVSAYEYANLKQVDSNEALKQYFSGSFTQTVLGQNPGTLSAYEIREMTADELAALQQWYLDSMTKVVGADRAQLILDKSMDKFPHMTTNASNALWLKPGVHRAIVISDYVDAKGVARSSWIDTYGSSGSGGTTNTRDPYPDDWADLLKYVRANVRPRDPTVTPQQLAVQKNLRSILTAATLYMGFNGLTEVSYSQLLNGPGTLLKPVTSIAGENYDGLVVHQGDASLSINVPGQGPVTYEP